MRLIGGFLFILVCAQPVCAQQQLTDEITALITALNDFKGVLSTTDTDIKQNLSPVEESLSKAADSLQVIANFSTTIQNGQNSIIFASIGALAAGVALGVLSATYLCSCSAKKNLFYRGYFVWKEWRQSRITL